MVRPSSTASRRITSSTSLTSSGSSAEVGSSSSSTLGLGAIARAIATRCCWPPDRCRGKRIGAMAEADAFEQFARRAGRHRPRNAVDPAQRAGDVLLRGQMAEQIELLEHHADADARRVHWRCRAATAACRRR